jgi:hypothetical protein
VQESLRVPGDDSLDSIDGGSVTTSEGLGNCKDGHHSVHKRIDCFLLFTLIVLHSEGSGIQGLVVFLA